VNELAERTRTHQSSVSVVVRRLVERDLVRRQTSRADARRVELELTDAGRDLLASAPPTVQSRMATGLQQMPPERVAALAGGLAEWLRNSGLEDPSPPMFGEETGGT
jgi:DNA-binding MarR family transcriptional regulator